MVHDILDVLRDAVLRGAAAVVAARRDGLVAARYKDATELVTEADDRSDAAMRAVFEARLPAIDPSIAFHLEESGSSGDVLARRRVGGDPLDGTSHFATGGNLYSVQAHYLEDGIPLAAAVCQPEAYCPLDVRERCTGRLVTALRGAGAWLSETEWDLTQFRLGEARRVTRRPVRAARTWVACVSITGKMTAEERALARRVHDSGLIGSWTGTGNAGGNVLWTILGGQDVYANFGAGDELDLAPPQLIAEEAGMTVWGVDRRPPIWHVRKQPVVVAPSPEVAELFLAAAGL
jgi:3'-phosphoadenosine 5'-phosphosulfate (PAPS) 3'-phosphatase